MTIPEGVTEIGYHAFRGCRNLESVTIPKSVTGIRGWAFADCTSLQSVTIPEGVTAIGTNTFYGCYSLESVTIPEGVTEIGSSAFSRCVQLQSVTIPESVTKICKFAFKGCTSLESVVIPKGVTAIGKKAFSECENLKRVSLQSLTIHNRRLPKINESIFGGFRISRPILIAPHLAISDFCEADRLGACMGFVKLYCDQAPLSEDIRASYLAYIRSERKALYPRAMEYLPLLQVMTAEKIIPPEDFEELFQDALQKGGAERTALLLEYRHKYLDPLDWEREFEIKEL